jgi:3-oxo-Delta1-steroid hydratase/dehydrogenase large subunit
MSQQNRSFKFISTNRRVKEDRKFVAGAGRFIADIDIEGVVHVALVASRYAAAKIISIDPTAALSMPGVHHVLTGEEIASAVNPLMNGLDTPNVRRFPLAIEQTRYAGEWVAAVVADSRALAEDAAELVKVVYEPLAYVLDPEEAYKSESAPVHPDHGTNVLLDKTFNWGEVDTDFENAENELSFRVEWGRNSTVPIETFGVIASWNPWTEMLDVWASIQMPKYNEQIARAMRIAPTSVRVHHDVDVGGSYGVKRGIKHTILVGHLSRLLNRPVRLIEDRLENMRGGDAHGPNRIFDVSVAYNNDGTVQSMKMRALDNAGAYAGRAPFQLGKPIGAIVGPYKIGSVRYNAISVTTNKAAQEAVRGFGQAPTNYAIEAAMDNVAEALDIDRIELRQRNFIRSDEFPYKIPSGTSYDSGDYHAVVDKVLAHTDYSALVAERNRLRTEGLLAGIGVAACLEPSGGNSSFEPLLNPANTTSTWMESVRINVDGAGGITVNIHTTSSGQGHETLASTVVGEVLEIDPAKIQVVRPDSLSAMPGNTPVGSRMAIMMGGAAAKAAEKIVEKLLTVGAFRFGCLRSEVDYADGSVFGPGGAKLDWAQLVHLCHREYHNLPDEMTPGLEASHVMQVPSGEKLPENEQVQMYPCHSFEFHLVLVAMDPILAKPQLLRYVIGHDCGTVINPDIVRGMTLGGIAHGIGAALLEEFAYDGEGQLMTQSFMDYLMPSSNEVPEIEVVHHCTPSPLTMFGQKGAGESGYLGSPAAISGAINDALSPLGVTAQKLPIRISWLGDAIAAARPKAE